MPTRTPGVLVIDEDRSSENQAAAVAGGYGRVLVYDLKHEDLRPVARVRTPGALPPGTWESSGVLNASALLGEDWWLLDVQAHDSTPKPQPAGLGRLGTVAPGRELIGGSGTPAVLISSPSQRRRAVGPRGARAVPRRLPATPLPRPWNRACKARTTLVASLDRIQPT
jgi:hypothetical protein